MLIFLRSRRTAGRMRKMLRFIAERSQYLHFSFQAKREKTIFSLSTEEIYERSNNKYELSGGGRALSFRSFRCQLSSCTRISIGRFDVAAQAVHSRAFHSRGSDRLQPSAGLVLGPTRATHYDSADDDLNYSPFPVRANEEWHRINFCVTTSSFLDSIFFRRSAEHTRKWFRSICRTRNKGQSRERRREYSLFCPARFGAIFPAQMCKRFTALSSRSVSSNQPASEFHKY